MKEDFPASVPESAPSQPSPEENRAEVIAAAERFEVVSPEKGAEEIAAEAEALSDVRERLAQTAELAEGRESTVQTIESHENLLSSPEKKEAFEKLMKKLDKSATPESIAAASSDPEASLANMLHHKQIEHGKTIKIVDKAATALSLGGTAATTAAFGIGGFVVGMAGFSAVALAAMNGTRLYQGLSEKSLRGRMEKLLGRPVKDLARSSEKKAP